MTECHRYRPLYRPAGYATLPAGVKWDYVELPNATSFERLRVLRPEIPVSEFPFGIIQTERPLTTEECAAFELDEVQS